MIYLRYPPSHVEGRLFVNRQRDREWLRNLIDRYLEDVHHGGPPGLALCVSGEKGSGKTILVQTVLNGLRESRSGNTLFLEVDCRRCRSMREVLHRVSEATRDELLSLRRAGSKEVTDALYDASRVLVSLTSMDDTSIELKTVHEQLEQFSAALGLGGEKQLLWTLNVEFGISLEYKKTQIRQLSGSIRLDAHRLCNALCAFFKDIREQGLEVLLWLDNIDELRHEYRDDETRTQVRRDVEGVLQLRNAPIGLVLALRTYFEGVLPRDVTQRKQLQPLPPEELLRIFDKRLESEDKPSAEAMRNPKVKGGLTQLAGMADTPLAFLTWVHYLATQEEIADDSIKRGLESFLRNYYAAVPLKVLQKVALLFCDQGVPISRAALLEACGGNEALLWQLQDRQVVLPQDFWNPNYFLLDPELKFLCQPTE